MVLNLKKNHPRPILFYFFISKGKVWHLKAKKIHISEQGHQGNILPVFNSIDGSKMDTGKVLYLFSGQSLFPTILPEQPTDEGHFPLKRRRDILFLV